MYVLSPPLGLSFPPSSFPLSSAAVAVSTPPVPSVASGSGDECLALQGFSHETQAMRSMKPPTEFTQQDKMDLAGNAFCAAVIIPLFLSMIASVPLVGAITFATEARPRHPATPTRVTISSSSEGSSSDESCQGEESDQAGGDTDDDGDADGDPSEPNPTLTTIQGAAFLFYPFKVYTDLFGIDENDAQTIEARNSGHRVSVFEGVKGVMVPESDDLSM